MQNQNMYSHQRHLLGRRWTGGTKWAPKLDELLLIELKSFLEEPSAFKLVGIHLLLERGANPDLQDGEPLRLAVEADNPALIETLINARADVTRDESDAMWLALKNPDISTETLVLLAKEGAMAYGCTAPLVKILRQRGEITLRQRAYLERSLRRAQEYIPNEALIPTIKKKGQAKNDKPQR